MALAVTLLIALFWPPLTALWGAWQQDEYSHGPLIPVLAALMGFNILQATRPAFRPSRWGFALLPLALAMLAVGTFSAFFVVSIYGFIVALIALLIVALGTEATRRLWPALAYLVFAVPLPNIFYVGLSSDLQLISSTLGVAALDLIGLPVYQDGNIIDLGVLKLQVVEACSGLRYLFPLMSFGYLTAYILEDRFWKRAVLFLSSIPVTIAMNSLRIAIVGVTVNLWGKEMAGGVLHDFEGWTVFLLCVFLLLVEMSLLVRIGRHGRINFGKLTLPRFSGFTGTPLPLGRPLFVFCGLLFVSTAIFLTLESGRSAEIVPQTVPLANFPLTLGEWHGRRDNLSSEYLGALQLTDYWIADYSRAPVKQNINFYIAYYASQRTGAAAHSPASCIPGGGWQIVDNTTKTVPLSTGKVTLQRIVIEKNGARQLVYYWFYERGRDLTNEISVKWWMLYDSLMDHRTDGSLIRIVAPLPAGADQDAVEKDMIAFLDAALPAAVGFLPGKS